MTAASQAFLSFIISWSLFRSMSTKSVMPSNHLILCHPLLLPSIFPSIRVFSNESALCIMWPKYWSFTFSISPSHEYSGLISFRIDWFDLLAVQETLKSLFQHQNSKASVLQCSAFFMVQISYSYMTTGKTIALAIWTFVSKVMSLHFNTLSGFVIAFLSRSKLKFMSIELVMLSNHLILCRCLLLLPSIFPSISVFYMGWLFASGCQSIGGLASATVLLTNALSLCLWQMFQAFSLSSVVTYFFFILNFCCNLLGWST